MLEQVARGAAADAGLGERVLTEIDTLAVVQVAGWRARNGPRLLAEKLGAHPAREIVTAVGGEMPITLVNHIAGLVSEGRVRVALIASSNNLRTLRLARKDKVKLDWTEGGDGEPEIFGVNKPGSSEREIDYGLRMPSQVYPIFENALRARRGLDLESHRRRVGALMSGFSAVAAENPYSWFPTARSADEITRPGPSNRMVAFPYTKYMNAMLETEQAAAVLMMSSQAARKLGVPERQQVHWWGGAHAEEVAWNASERPDFAECPALRNTVSTALLRSGVGIDDLHHLDFYSCFPVAVEMACEMLGIDEADPRGLTVTGGLPYAGGPGNGYTLHSLATMMDRLRKQPGTRGLVTGNGWYLTKHSALVASTEAPPPDRVREAEPDAESDRATAVGPATAPVIEAAAGPGTLETYTVLFDRGGAPSRGIVLGRTREGGRFLANLPEDRSLLETFTASEQVGCRGSLSSDSGRCVFDPA
jgi:acetyl-CoA C-acetyltransferase